MSCMGIINRIGGHGVSLAELKAAVVAIGPSLLLDADSVAGADGDAVGSWADDSGNDVDFSQSNASYKPVLKKSANGINGHNVIRFDGSNDILSIVSGKVLSDIITASADNCFFVFKLVAVTTSNSTMYKNDCLIADNGGAWGTFFKTDGYVYSYYYSSSTKSAENSISTGIAYILASRHSGGSIYQSINGGTENSEACGNVAVTGDVYLGGLEAYTQIDIAEIICFKSNLSSANRDTVMNYLNTKYSIY